MIYIEQIILIDLLIHHCLIFLTSLLTLFSINKINMIISDFINILIVCLYFMLHISLKWELLLVLLMEIIIFKKNIVSIIVYFFLNIALGGISSIIYFNFNYHWFYLLFILLIFIISGLIYLFKYKGILKKALYYEARIDGLKSKLFLFLDTGNKLYDNENNPIIIINKKYKNYLKASNNVIEINTINGSTKEVCYKCEGFYIKIKRKYIKFRGSIILRDNIGDGIIGLGLIGG